MSQQFDCLKFLVLYGYKIHALVTQKYTTIKIMQEKNDNTSLSPKDAASRYNNQQF